MSRGAATANLLALEYRSGLRARGLAPKTIARRLAALRSVVKLARTLGRVSWTLEVSAPQTESYRDTSGPGADGWRRMAARVRDRAAESLGHPVSGSPSPEGEGRGGGRAVSRSGAKPVRDYAIVRLLHDLALRREEAVELDVSDVELADGTPSAISILGKGRAERERLTLAPRTALALGDWIRTRGPTPGPLFGPLDRPRTQ